MFWACFLLVLCCLCYFLFPNLRGVHLLSGRLRRGGHSAVQHDRDEAFYQRLSGKKMVSSLICGVAGRKMKVLFQSLDSGQTITLCVDVNILSRILECYGVRLDVGAVDKFFTYTRVYFFSHDYNFNVSALHPRLVYRHIYLIVLCT